MVSQYICVNQQLQQNTETKKTHITIQNTNAAYRPRSNKGPQNCNAGDPQYAVEISEGTCFQQDLPG